MKKIHLFYIHIILIINFFILNISYSQSYLTVKINGTSEQIKCEIINYENYVQLADFTDILKKVDESAKISWESNSGILSVKIQNKSFSFSSDKAMIIINNTMLNTRLPILFMQGRILIPESTFNLMFKFLSNAEVETKPSDTSKINPPQQPIPPITPSISQEVTETNSPIQNETSYSTKVTNLSNILNNNIKLSLIKNVAIVPITNNDETGVSVDIANQCKTILDSEGSLKLNIFNIGEEQSSLDKKIEEINVSDSQLLIVIKTAISHYEEIYGFRIYCVSESVDVEGRNFHNDLQEGKVISYNVNYLPFEEYSLMFGKILEKEMIKSVPTKDLVITLAPIYLLKHIAMPSVLIETGYLSNEKERNNLYEASYRAQLARVICGAILRFKNEINQSLISVTTE